MEPRAEGIERMQFALLGDHPDGLDMARALAASGRHELATYTGPASGAETLRRSGLVCHPVRDLEEVLADPRIEAVLVASRLADRPAHLRRALQSERHVLCVHPADETPDSAYEAAMIQGDTRCVLLPLLPEALHPGVLRLAQLARSGDGPLGTVRLMVLEFSATDSVLAPSGLPGLKHALPGWDLLRALGGEIAEVSAFAGAEEVDPHQPLLLAGRFAQGALFQVAFLPNQAEERRRLTVIGSFSRAVLTFPEGWPGPAQLVWQDATGELREENWETWNPWPVLVEAFEAALSRRVRAGSADSQGVGLPRLPLSWQQEIRSLELDDAVRRSVQRRRVSTLEYPEATEEVGFKGTMTLTGCAILWTILFLLIASIWLPWAGWAIIPVLVAFLLLQILRWLIPGSSTPSS
jgi:predicted dehydrogenase